MAPFEQLQELWQRQRGPSVPAVEIAKLTSSMRAYGRRQNWINAGKAFAVSLAVAWGVSHVGSSRPAMAGIGLVAVMAGLLLFDEWRKQRAIARRDFGAPSAGFVRETIEKLEAQRTIPRKYAVGMVTVVLIMNLIEASRRTVWLRVAISLCPLIGFELGLMVRRLRWNHDVRPLVEKLRRIESALKERAE